MTASRDTIDRIEFNRMYCRYVLPFVEFRWISPGKSFFFAARDFLRGFADRRSDFGYFIRIPHGSLEPDIMQAQALLGPTLRVLKPRTRKCQQ
ncbi:MAG: hypothetical protein K0S45_2870 [Nitrospira sp.]|jgi:hypothetical protein|nr:hypothetical protein [Nitrospira sp.]